MNIVVLTGAGISAESGIKTFRDENGLWEGHRVEEVATPEAFASNSKLVYDFYNLRRAQLLDPKLKPNDGHLALARLEAAFPGSFTLVTQNVDNLHERAGCKNVLHMHGELQKIRCLQSGECYQWTEELNEKTPHPKGLNSPLRPDIVWFGEIPKHLDQIEQDLLKADLFICAGTSGVVYPAAGFVQLTPRGCKKIEFNLEETPISRLFDETVLGETGKTLPDFVDSLIP